MSDDRQGRTSRSGVGSGADEPLEWRDVEVKDERMGAGAGAGIDDMAI
jgi:hypothetical protein